MGARSDIAGLVLAGGQSSRFGSNKALAVLGGETLAGRMVRLLGAHCRQVALSAKEKLLGPYVPTLPDPAGTPAGAMSGVLAGLEWAEFIGAQWLVTAPCDTPLLPEDFSVRLVEAAEVTGVRAAMIASGDGVHPLCAAWSVDLLDRVTNALAQGHPPVSAFLEEIGAAHMRVADEHLLNVNTPADLERAGQALAKQY